MTSPATEKTAHNRRTAYTKTAIRRTFFELLEEKDFDRISVREICQRADINRSTFYRHYDDINALMNSIEAEFVADIGRVVPVDRIEQFGALFGQTAAQGEARLFAVPRAAARGPQPLENRQQRLGGRFKFQFFAHQYENPRLKWKRSLFDS